MDVTSLDVDVTEMLPRSRPSADARRDVNHVHGDEDLPGQDHRRQRVLRGLNDLARSWFVRRKVDGDESVGRGGVVGEDEER